MEPIPVPAPPKSAFNKNRRVSDLLLGQLRHFQHVEEKQGIAIDPALKRDIQTEAGAARYIAQITRAIRSQSQGSQPAQIAVMPSAPPFSKPSTEGLALAAAASSTSPPMKPPAKKNSKKAATEASKRKQL